MSHFIFNNLNYEHNCSNNTIERIKFKKKITTIFI